MLPFLGVRFQKLLCFLLIALFSSPVNGQLYKDPTLPLEDRVSDLLSKMTIEEKFWQVFMVPSDGEISDGKFKHGVFGLQVHATTGADSGGQMLKYDANHSARELAEKINSLQQYFRTQTRLGIPIIPFDEALHGLVRQGATVFPQAIGMAASFDTALVSKVATQIAWECRSRGIRQILSPVVNLASDVRWGRTEETYGEDPHLSANMGIAFMKAFEKSGIITTPKHFVANTGDGGRDSYPIGYSQRYLDLTHFVPFKAAFSQAGARSVMTAYNSLDGTACSANPWLLTKKLKEDWGFRGFVISDANAVGGEVVLHKTAGDYAESGAHAINAGLDVIFQTDHRHANLFYPAFRGGLVNLARLDDAVSRVLRAKFELGLFEDPYVPVTSQKTAENEAKALTRMAAEKSFVMLKNKGNLLPLTPGKTKIAVFGRDAAHVRLGGYSGPGYDVVSILEGLKTTFEVTSYEETVSYRDPGFPAIDKQYLSSDNGAGLHAEYFSAPIPEGQPVSVRTDEKVDFSWTLYGPAEATGNHFYSVRWTGDLVVPETGNYRIGLEGNDGYRMYFDGKLVIDRWQKTGYHTDLRSFRLKKGSRHSIRIEFYEPAGNGKIRLIWDHGIKDNWQKDLKRALTRSAYADVSIVVAGIHEGEFQDRASLKLPGGQEELINALHKTGKPVVVLLVGGSAVTMQNWLESADAVICLWYPGQEGGAAVANVLSGKTSPGGKLPVTFPVSEGQLPLSYLHLPTGRGDGYHDLSGEPLFPFGYGMSYTTFSYGDAKLQNDTILAGEATLLEVNLQNTGKMTGDEVVQLYIRPVLTAKARPVLQLRAFRKVTLLPGEKRDLRFHITADMFSTSDDNMKEITEPGVYEILTGSSSRDLRTRSVITVLEKR